MDAYVFFKENCFEDYGESVKHLSSQINSKVEDILSLQQQKMRRKQAFGTLSNMNIILYLTVRISKTESY